MFDFSRETNSSIRLSIWRGEHTRSRRKRMRPKVLARVRRKRAKDRECGSAYDGRFPVGWIKNSILKRPRARDNPLSRGTEGRPFRREGTYNAWGVCLLVCPIYTATVRENSDVSRSLSLWPFLFLPSGIFSFSLAHSLPLFRPLMCTSPHEYRRGQAPDVLWDPSSDPSQSGYRMTILLWKSETLGWIEPLCNPRGVRRRRRDRSGVRVLNVYRLADEKHGKERTKTVMPRRKERAEEERKGDPEAADVDVVNVDRREKTLREIRFSRERDRFSWARETMRVGQSPSRREREREKERTSSSFFPSWRSREPLISPSSRRFRVRHEY